jgi:F420-non-reducing hydrogenase small subunit
VSGEALPTLAVGRGAACGGCDVALLNLGQRLLAVAAGFEIVHWSCLLDFKLDDLHRRADASIDLCLFNGAIRTSSDEAMLHLLRAKSRRLVAFGSCAHEGCVPALANLATVHDLLVSVFLDNPSTANPQAVVPLPTSAVSEGELSLPVLRDTVCSLEQLVPVDHVVPGCPPEPDQVWSALCQLEPALEIGARPSPPGRILGAAQTPLCDECPLPRRHRRITGLVRPHELVPNPEECLLEQGLICLGPATRGGCGALCPRVGVGCRGCYGPAEGVCDLGAAMVDAVAALVEAGKGEVDEAKAALAVEAAIESVVDPAGTFYRYGLAGSLLRRARPAGAGVRSRAGR